MKDECNGIIIREFIALRPKLFALITENNHVEKKTKGVTRDVLQREITYDDYLNALHSENDKTCLQTTIKSKNLIINTIMRNKVAINSKDDK